MIIFILSLFFILVVDTFLIGIAFYALKDRYDWKISPKLTLFILFIIFALFENYALPIIYILDATVTIGNQEISSALDISPNMPLIELFELGFFEFSIWLIQAFFAVLIGEKLIKKKSK